MAIKFGEDNMGNKEERGIEVLEKFEGTLKKKIKELNENLHDFFKLDFETIFNDTKNKQNFFTRVSDEKEREKMVKELIINALNEKKEEANQKSEAELESVGLEVEDITKVQDIIHELGS